MSWRILAICLLSTWVQAQSLLIVRGDGDYPPFEMMRDGKLAGAHIELIEAAAQEAGLAYKIESLPWTRALEMVKRGHADAVMFASRSAEREAYLLFEPDNVLSTLTFSFFRLQGAQGLQKWDGDFQRLIGQRIGVLRSYSYPNPFAQAPNLQKLELDGGNQALSRALLNNRLELVVANTVEMNHYLAEQGLAGRVHAIPPTFGQDDAYLAFAKAKESDGLSKRFAEAFRKLRARGTYQKIWARYQLSR